MAISKCIKCDGTVFELKSADHVVNSKFKINFVQCSTCGGVVGVLDYYNIGAQVNKLLKKFGLPI